MKELVPGDANGKNANRTGSLRCASEDALLVVDVSIRGEAMRDDVDGDPGKWIDSIVTIEANGVMKPKKEGGLHSAFLPVFLERRLDKTAANTLAEIFDQFDNAIKNIADLAPV
ncbi:hypothetical protein [Chromobacterium phragmitis]|uniref:Uncharacterized protein n=1 Tax=Chromobacterium phragmitis TaxID=2202141 RepID=A0ABV0J2S0_9NEIS